MTHCEFRENERKGAIYSLFFVPNFFGENENEIISDKLLSSHVER